MSMEAPLPVNVHAKTQRCILKYSKYVRVVLSPEAALLVQLGMVSLDWHVE